MICSVHSTLTKVYHFYKVIPGRLAPWLLRELRRSRDIEPNYQNRWTSRPQAAKLWPFAHMIVIGILVLRLGDKYGSSFSVGRWFM
jgi:hypothetical protein